MGRNNWFRFKLFKVIQEHAALKVGVDGVLAGAWANPDGCSSILDIGTGTGVIALMMAQRSSAFVTAIDIDEPSCMEAALNFSYSPWSERLTILHASFTDFAERSGQRFDLIVSNPPFFNTSCHPPLQRRKDARHNDSLPFEELMAGVKKLLSTNGRFAVIIPAKSEEIITRLASKNDLYLNRITYVRPNPSKLPHRCLMEFSCHAETTLTDTLTIENLEHGDYTEAYKKLTADFYLAF